MLRHPEFAQWCGTELAADWHRRFDTAVLVCGPLRFLRSEVHDGVPFEEVSPGYPREWGARPEPVDVLRAIPPRPSA